MAVLIYLGTSVILGIVYLFVKAWRVNQHWKNLGVAHEKPWPLFGNMLDLVLKRRTQPDIIKGLYAKFPDETVIGYYHFMSPRLIIRKQDLVERILTSDFAHFADRVQAFDPKGNPLLANLFGLTGQRWRAMRSKLSPMFTTGKLRFMLPQVSGIADDFTILLGNKSTHADIKDLTSKFAMEVISSCAFGIEPVTMVDGEDSEFSTEAKIAFESSFSTMLKRLIFFGFPKLAGLFGIGFMSQRTEKYFSGVIKTALRHRKETKAVRNDFVQQMVTLLDKGFIEIEKYDPGDEYLDIKEKSGREDVKLELNDDVMVAQAFVFLLAGFETTSTAMTYLCLDFALNPDKQDLARREVNQVIDSGDWTYDSIRSMSYLEGCMKESLRLHPPVGHLFRTCVKSYQIPGTSVVVEPGQLMVISASGVHENPEIYTDPEKFLPERWNSDMSYPPCTFLPFGDGPRICIGMRFATMEVKCCVAKILRNYRISLHPSTSLPIVADPFSFFGAPLKPIILRLEKL